jgi:hypothetical protein
MRLQVDHIVVGRFQVMVEVRQHPDLLLHDPVRVRRCVQTILLIDIKLQSDLTEDLIIDQGLFAQLQVLRAQLSH